MTTPLFTVCYAIYSIFKSIAFSLLLALRLLLRRISAPCTTSKEIGNIIALYEGTIYHERRHPAHNSFRLRVRHALIDLDRPPYAPPKYLSADEVRAAAKTNGPVYLLMIPPSVGYDYSPADFYYCYDIEGSTKILKKCLFKATNTPWGESVTFVFNPSSDLVPKCEYISPYVHMLSKWGIKAKEPGETVFAAMTVEHPTCGSFFSASLTAKRVMTMTASSSVMTSDDLESFFWLMPHRVAFTTYLTGLRLWWKRVPFNEHPRRQNPAYREEMLARDEKIQLCPMFGVNNMRTQDKIDRCFTWRDAKWPWSTLVAYEGKKTM